MQMSPARGGSTTLNLLKLSLCKCIHLCDEGIWVRSQSWLKVLYWAVLGFSASSVWLQSGGLSEISNGITQRYSKAISYLKYTGYKSFMPPLTVWFFHTLTLKRWWDIWDCGVIKETWHRSDKKHYKWIQRAAETVEQKEKQQLCDSASFSTSWCFSSTIQM